MLSEILLFVTEPFEAALRHLRVRDFDIKKSQLNRNSPSSILTQQPLFLSSNLLVDLRTRRFTGDQFLGLGRPLFAFGLAHASWNLAVKDRVPYPNRDSPSSFRASNWGGIIARYCATG